MPERLDGETVLLTGASSGIGAAAARRLASAGARLIVNARRKERLEAVAKETGAVAVPGDVCDPEVRARLLEAAGPRVAVLVNNAGYPQPGPVESVTGEEARRQLDVNLFSAAALIRAVLPGMRAAGSGRILNLSSIAGRFGYPLFGWYCASKHALEGLSDALRLEVAPFGIFVVLIEPGPVTTEFVDVAKAKSARMLSDADSPYAPVFRATDEIEARFAKQSTSPEKVADVVFRAATARRPRARYAITPMAKLSLLALRFLPRSLLDRVVKSQFRIPAKLPRR